MSLINDALKRAKQLQTRPAAPVTADPALQPVIETPAVPVRLPKLAPISAAVLILLSGWFLALWWRGAPPEPPPPPEPTHRTEREIAALRETVVPPKVAPAEPPFTPERLRNELASKIPAATTVAPPLVRADPSPPAPQPPAAAPRVETGVPSHVETATVPIPAAAAVVAARAPEPTAAAAEPDGTPTELKLQGIFYRLTKPSVLIDGQVLFVGDEIEGARVTKIERQVVHLVQGGKTILLKLR